jgi:hypothetical protein
MVKSLIKMISSPNNAPEIGETGLVKNDKFRLLYTLAQIVHGAIAAEG